MCGIAGMLASSGVDRSALARAAAAIAHRGPDGSGFLAWAPEREVTVVPRVDDMPFEPTVGLAHRRLTIIDLSHASDQPMVHAEARLGMVYNGELYNYIELREQLEGLGHRFRTTGDTEVVLRGYAEWGEACVERFVGMWAFAIIDVARRRLFLSRDRFGIKPLFTWNRGGRFCFASEIKALLAMPGVEPQPDADVLATFLATGLVDYTERTFFDGILRVPPAHNVIVPLDGEPQPRIWRYWEAPPEAARNHSDAEAIAAFREAFDTAVRVHLRSDVPVGTCLSGGLDSSSIVCVADELRRNGSVSNYAHHAFGYVPPDSKLSERRHMEHVVRATGVEMTYVTPTEEEFRRKVLDVVALQDEPFGSTSMAAQWFVFEAAREAGIKVMLDGQGADEVLGGYHSYLTTMAARLLSQRRPIAYARFALEHRRETGRPAIPIRTLVGAVAPPPLLRAIARVRPSEFMLREAAAAAMAPEFRDRRLPLPEAMSRPASLHETLKVQTEAMSVPSLLRFEDRNSMDHSIEARVPFLDHRLVESVFRMPADLKIRGARTKYLLREAMAGTLPEPVRTRRDKIGFRADPAVTWTLARDHRDAIVENRTELEDRWFDRGGVTRLLDGGDRSAEHEYLVWRVINAKLWLRQHWGHGGDALA